MSPVANRRNFSWQILVIAGFTLTIAIFFAYALWLVLNLFTNTIYDYATDETEALAQSVAVMVENSVGTQLDEALASTVEGRDYRVILFDSSLNVLADSNRESDESAIPTGPELIQAYSTGAAIDRRTGENANIIQIFAARRCTVNGTDAIVQVSTDTRSLSDAVTQYQAIGLGALFACLLVSSLLCYALFQRASTAARNIERAQSRFVANASHELKTPIAGIKLLAESISRSAQKENYDHIPEFAERIEDESDRLAQVVKSLIEMANTMSKPQGRAKRQRLIHVDACKATRDAFESHRIHAEEKHLKYTLSIDTPPKRKCMIKLPSQSSESSVADVLIENAIAYTKSGFVEVKLRTEGDMLLFSVSDSGAGISPQEQDMVFERYYRARHAQSANPNGSGIGLAMARDAIRAAGGDITVVSTPGQGSTFTATIPFTLQQ